MTLFSFNALTLLVGLFDP